MTRLGSCRVGFPQGVGGGGPADLEGHGRLGRTIDGELSVHSGAVVGGPLRASRVPAVEVSTPGGQPGCVRPSHRMDSDEVDRLLGERAPCEGLHSKHLYLSLVRTWHEYCTGLDLCKGISMVRSRRLVRGLRRKYPSSSARSVRKAMVRSTLVAWRQSRSRALPRDDAYKWLAALLAFKFLLRPGEVCKPQAARWNPQRMLCRGDLRLGVSRSPAGKLVHTLTIFPLKKGPGQAKDLVIPFEDDSGQVMSVVDAYMQEGL